MTSGPASSPARRRLLKGALLTGAVLLVLALSLPLWEPALLSVLPTPWVRSLARGLPDDGALQREWGERARRAQELDDAATALTAAARLTPGDPELLAHTALVLAERGDLEGARGALEEALELDGKNRDALAVRARWSLQTEGPSAALEQLRPLLARHPEAAEAWYVQGLCYSQLRNSRLAAEAFGRAIRLDPLRAAFFREAAQIRHEVGALAEGEGLARRAVALAPGDPSAALVLARILLDRSPTAAARAEVRALLRQSGQSPSTRADALRELGRLCLQEGDPRAAVPFLEEAAERAPDDAKSLYYLAEAYRRTGDRRAEPVLARFRSLEGRQREETFLRAAVKEQLGAFPPRRRLVEFYLRTGRRDQAALVLQDYLQRVPGDPAAMALGKRLGL